MRGAKPQITCNDIIKNFRKEQLFMRPRYCGMEDQKLEPGLACTLNLLTRKELNQKVKRFPNLSKLGDIVSKLVLTLLHQRLRTGR